MKHIFENIQIDSTHRNYPNYLKKMVTVEMDTSSKPESYANDIMEEFCAQLKIKTIFRANKFNKEKAIIVAKKNINNYLFRDTSSRLEEIVQAAWGGDQELVLELTNTLIDDLARVR